MTVLEFENASKKYYLGQGSYGSLREKIPLFFRNLASRAIGRDPHITGNQDIWALKDVSFKLKQGEALGIIGPNGSGKSTILKLLAGVTTPTEGRVWTEGRVAALIELGAGFHPELTGRDNIYLNGAIMGMKKGEIDEKFDSIVAFSELDRFIDTPVKRYSSGMFARLGFSVAAHVDPDILLVDEVLSVGDIGFQVKCLRRMEEYRQRGTTVIFVSHNLEAVRNLCKRAILLYNGEIAVNDSTEKAIGKYFEIMSTHETTFESESPDGPHTKKAEIVNFQLLNSTGSPAFTFNTGDEVTLVLAIVFHSDIDSPLFGFIVRRNDRLIVMDTNSVFLGAGTRRFRDGTRLKVKFKFVMNLLRGSYYVASHILDKNRRDFYDYVDNAITFDVNESYSFAGVADLRPTCEIAEMT